MALYLRAPAKVNLYLRVLGRRDDGYHEIDTLFHSLALADELYAEPADEGVELTVVGAASDISDDADNLVCRAAHALRRAAGARSGLRFLLRKRIPVGGGLGGGSSDAAAALRLANAIYGNPLRERELGELARSLGADVPFFLLGGTQRGLGVGERLSEVQGVPHLYFALVVPPFGSSTQTVFENHARTLRGARVDSTIVHLEISLPKEIALGKGVGNDLERAAMRCYPRLAEMRDAIRSAGIADVRMTGSGSTLFIARETFSELTRVENDLRSVARRFGADLTTTESDTEAPGGRPSERPWPGTDETEGD